MINVLTVSNDEYIFKILLPGIFKNYFEAIIYLNNLKDVCVVSSNYSNFPSGILKYGKFWEIKIYLRNYK